MGVSIRAGSALVGVASLFLLGACGDKVELVNVIPRVATQLVVVSGDQQTGVAGAALANPIVVSVLDQNGNAVAGATVTWTIIGASGSVSSPTSTSNAAGEASVVWTLGTTAGADSLQASLPNGANVILTATGTAGPATTLAMVSGDLQIVVFPGTSAPMVVLLTDANGNPVANATINWASSIGGLSAASTTTDAAGQASVTLAPPAPLLGAYTVSADTSPSTTPVLFTGTAF